MPFETVASLKGGARSGCHYFEVTPFYDNNRTKKKTTVCLTSLEMFSILEWTKKMIIASFETFIQNGGGNLSKI